MITVVRRTVVELAHRTLERVVARPLEQLDEWLTLRAAPLPLRTVRLARGLVTMALMRLDGVAEAASSSRTRTAKGDPSLEWDDAWEAPPEVPVVPPTEIDVGELLATLRDAVAPLVLDVREPHETTTGVLPGARLLPMATVLAHIGELRDLQQASSLPAIVYCAHGTRSSNVATHLRDRGVPALSLRGGIAKWREAGGTVAPPGPPKANA